MSDAEVDVNTELDNELEIWENLFSDRYTEKDEDYVKIKAKQLPPQPTCIPWIIQSKLLKRGWEWTRNRDRNRRDWDRNRRPHSHHGDNYNERDRSQGDRYRKRNSDEHRNRSFDDRDRYQDGSKRMRR